MRRNYLAIGLLCFYLLAYFQPMIPLLSYWTNQSYYANVLCVNRSKPNLLCRGKCALMKRMAQNSSDPQENCKNERRDFESEIHLPSADLPQPVLPDLPLNQIADQFQVDEADLDPVEGPPPQLAV